MKKKNIEFIKVHEGVSDYYAPKSSIQMLPEWFKKTKPYMGPDQDKIVNSGTNGTIKKCIPVLDSLSAGYFIVTHCDISIKWDGIHYEFDLPLENKGFIRHQPVEQIELHPDNGRDLDIAPKYKNPWGIKTPKGYSCLIIPPMHRDNLIVILPGIVDTDTYNDAVQLPFVMKNREQDSFIPAGTPIAQIIPFKRESWISSTTSDFKIALSSRTLRASMFLNSYKNRFWSKKSYE